MKICQRAFFAALSILAIQATASAQQPQPDTVITFAGMRVPACSVSQDPEYGLTRAKPIQLGGGPSNAGPRMTRFLAALRGPNGETLKMGTRGSLLAPPGYMDEPTIIDNYSIMVGDQPTSLYVDEYHYSIPKAPMGFTCVGPLVVALGPPPIEPLLLSRSMVKLAIEKGAAAEIPAVPLDVSTPRGFLFDQFTMIAQRARAAANAGTPIDASKPPSDMDPAGLAVLAFPIPCGDRTLMPQRIEVTGPQGAPVPQSGAVVRDEPLVKMFPLQKLQPGSIGARFRQSQVSGFKIVYSEGCNATPAEVNLLVRVEAYRAPLRPLPLPAGVIEAEPSVYLQAILDPNGEFSSIEYLGGPKSLLPVAIEGLRQLRSTPVRLNGVAIANPIVIPVAFQTQ